MNERQWLSVGVKLLGVVLCIYGIIYFSENVFRLVSHLNNVNLWKPRDVSEDIYEQNLLTEGLRCFLGGFLCLKGDWIAGLLVRRTEDKTTPKPPNEANAGRGAI